MATIFLLLIYLTFISLGLPDSLLGAAWPAMWPDLGVELGSAGIISMVVSGGTILSSLFSERLIRRFGTGKITAFSVLATASALLGFSIFPHFGMLILFAIPLGIGAGAIDSALNNYVALHYQARHMNWLHCFWGIGAFIGPIIMAASMRGNSGWQGGYFIIAIIQFGITALLFLSLPMWAKQEKINTPLSHTEKGTPLPPAKNIFKVPGVTTALLTFFCYCSVEAAVGLWGSSFMVETRGLSQSAAALAATLYFGGITGGRMLSGFLSNTFNGGQLIRMGGFIILAGVLLLALPLPVFYTFAAFLIIGLGCAPVYPSMIHETPVRFGAENSQKVIGLQMATAYTGTTFVPPLIGLAARTFGIGILPFVLFPLTLLMLICAERITKVTTKSRVK